MTSVNLQRPVTIKRLEQACIKAAAELGYKTKVKEIFTKEYRLGSVHVEERFAERSRRISAAGSRILTVSS